MRVVLFALFVTGCVAQVPKPCESPSRWEGKRIFIGEERPLKVISRVYYDAVGKRERDVEEVEQGKEKDFYDVLRLYTTMKEYRVDIHTKKCNVTTMKKPWRPIAIPSDAKFFSAVEVGPVQIPLEHLVANTFYGNFSNTDNYMVTHTFPSCIPIAHLWYEKSATAPTIMYEARYYDIHVGKYDPSHFDIPMECM